MDKRLEVAGWVLWMVGIAFFFVSGVVNGDPWTLAGSVLFGMGVVFIMIPLLRRKAP